jgi:hypothetical protein
MYARTIILLYTVAQVPRIAAICPGRAVSPGLPTYLPSITSVDLMMTVT